MTILRISGLALGAAVVSCVLLAGCSRDRQQTDQTAKASAALNIAPKLSDFVVYAQNSSALGELAIITGGDVGVTHAGSGSFLNPGFQLSVGAKAQVTTTNHLIADSVLLQAGATVGDVQTNRLTDRRSNHGQVGPFVSLPPLPALAPVTPGSEDLSVPPGSTIDLPAGASYRVLKVGQQAIVRLTGGTYQLGDLAVDAKGRLEASAPTELRIAGRMSLATLSYAGPATGTSLSARALRIGVSGINGSGGGLRETPVAAAIQEKAQARALVLVPNGRLLLAEKAVVQGALLARDVDVKSKAQVIFQDGFQASACPASCDDNDPCTADGCSGSNCTHAPTPGASCGDGDACNGAEACDATGACVAGTPVVCAAPDQCHDVGTCNPQTGACSNPSKPEVSPCDDGNACTLGDGCRAGACVGTPKVCEALSQCHEPSTCDATSGVCSTTPKANGAPCNDGDACTRSDTCSAGLCSGADPVVCAALDQCHVAGTCDSATGACSQPPIEDFTACSDGSPCTTGEMCLAGTCQSGLPVPVDDGNACTTDSCDPQQGPVHTPVVAGTVCPSGFCLGAPLSCTSLAIHIDSPASLLTVGSFPIQVTGTVNLASAAVTVNGVVVDNVDGKFSASVALAEGHNTIMARAVAGGHESTDSITISLDVTPPYVTVEYPANEQTVYSNLLTVTGLINDIVRGTIEQAQAKVTVNGIPATISNRSYAAEGVPLVVGENLLTVVGTDQVGNLGTTELKVHYVVPTGRRLQIVSGQDQAASIGEVLPQPLLVKVVDDALAPVADAPVVFRVTQDSGHVGAGTTDEARAVVVRTNAQGLASTRFKLGMRSGSANQKARAKVVGYDDEALFYASAVARPGNKISVSSGNNQRSATGATLPEPLVVVVTDEGANVVQGASVRFDVTQGEGTLSNGAMTFETQTDSDGRATVEYTPGPIGGLDAQRVTATLLSATGTEVINAGFTATAFVPGPPGLTTISGVVLDNQDMPLEGVTIRVGATTRQAVTSDQGQFKITEAPVGPVHLLADPSTTTAEGEYPTLSYNLVTVSGVDNPLAAPIYMVKLNVESSVHVGPNDAAIELPEYPGLKLEVAKGSATFPDGSKEGLINITSVNASAVPMAPPNGMQPQFIISIQPTGTRFDPPARLSLPNVDGHPPGTQTDMYSYDHDLEEFVSIGLGTVSEDGSVVASNIGVGVVKAGWHCGSQPTGQGCAAACAPCQRSALGCACVPDPTKDGTACTSSGCNVCQGGSCVTSNATISIAEASAAAARPNVLSQSPRPELEGKSAITSDQEFLSFLSSDQVTVRAELSGSGDASSISWSVIPMHPQGGDIGTTLPQTGNGASLTFQPAPPASDVCIPPCDSNTPAGVLCRNANDVNFGSLAAKAPLKYRIEASFCGQSAAWTITQAPIDRIRQEYYDHAYGGGAVANFQIPNSSDFREVVPTADYSERDQVADNSNPPRYNAYTTHEGFPSTLLLGTPGDLAQRIRDEFRRRIIDDVQMSDPGDAFLTPDTVVVAPGPNVPFVGAMLETEPCRGSQLPACTPALPFPLLCCDDARRLLPTPIPGVPTPVIVAGPNGVAETTANNDPSLDLTWSQRKLPIITSTWRNPERNERIGGSCRSRHQFGNAVDLWFPSEDVGGKTQAQLYCIAQAAAQALGLVANVEPPLQGGNCDQPFVPNKHLHVNPAP